MTFPAELHKPLCPNYQTNRKAASRLHSFFLSKPSSSIPNGSRIPCKFLDDLSTPELLRHSAASTDNDFSSVGQMIITWRCIRLSPLSSRPATTSLPRQVHIRLRSTCPTASSNIATILATPPGHGGHTITVEGSIRTIRNQKQRSFVELGDGSTAFPLQAVLEPQLAEGHVQ